MMDGDTFILAHNAEWVRRGRKVDRDAFLKERFGGRKSDMDQLWARCLGNEQTEKEVRPNDERRESLDQATEGVEKQNSNSNGERRWDPLLVYPKKEHNQIDDPHRQKIRDSLNVLCGLISFHVPADGPTNCSDPDEETIDPGLAGCCKALEGPLLEFEARRFPQGCRSRIELDMRTIREDVAKCYTEKEPETRLPFFMLASTIMHELSHAIHNAIFGQCMECFVGNSTCAEQGFEMEKHLFGGDIGTVTFQQPKTRHQTAGLFEGLTIEPWVSAHTVNSYADVGQKLGCIGDLGSYTKFKRVSTQTLDTLFSERFWLSAPSLGHKPLLPLDGPEWISKNGDYGSNGVPVLCSLKDPKLPDDVSKYLRRRGNRLHRHRQRDWSDNLRTSQWLWERDVTEESRKRRTSAAQDETDSKRLCQG